ncbi:thiol:disulfide interchange protein DsbA/DsbL [Alteromonas sp. ASW11-130]|uniref:thiol:disulfide interchange protein DsbA/DsbL n=1 Tax=Alteromonas sp. ASW11-130 TaxID=3015775 RepID=UPI0022420C20|nr:thiol:disulfide interchange protein DsbA/DsbL [Alteromonas sp. ASW11-130]MCW8090526.1 thiol:disulfide interchange protein DsbA/DsbL [Alteromonas sp. ASW11-130]
MKKFALLIFMALLIPLQACAQESKWQEDKHYVVLDEEATASPEIKEFFSFWCPACYSFEPLVDQIKQKLPEDVKFTKVHVNFMGFTSSDIQDDATRAMMIAQAVKQEEKLNAAIFAYIHKQRATVSGLKDLKNIFVVNGVDKAEFDKLANSFGVNSMLKKNNQQVDVYREYLKGVPTFIINGKYRPVFTRDMTADDIVDLIVWLSSKK